MSNGLEVTNDAPERAPRPIEPAQRTAARVVGALYLLQMATGVFGQVFVRDRLIVHGNVEKTAQNIIAHERLFRLSIAGDLITYTAVIVLIWAFYIVVRPINRNLALLAVLFRLAENVVLCVATICSLVALRLLSGTGDLKAFLPEQLYSLATLIIHVQGLGMNVGFVLLGLGSALFAWVLLKARYVPAALPILGIFGSLLLAVGTLAVLIFPRLGSVAMACMMPMGLYEVSLGLWLLVRGLPVDVTGMSGNTITNLLLRLKA
jgi:hypothetical protein